MEDSQIIDLYWNRDQQAIEETADKYGGLLTRISQNILRSPRDAEECVNDTYLAAWNTIPPERPRTLGAYLGRIIRNLSISRYRANHAQKRYAGLEAMLSELEECVPGRADVEAELERRELGALLSSWLDALPREERDLFLRRYWYGEAVQDLAREAGLTPNQASQRLFRLRGLLRTMLESKGVDV